MKICKVCKMVFYNETELDLHVYVYHDRHDVIEANS